MFNSQNIRIGVIGLGYVGLPLAVEFSKHIATTGFDANVDRIKQLKLGIDSTREVTSEELREADKLTFSHDAETLADCNVFIIAVPTPIDVNTRPDLTPLVKASQTVGKALKKEIPWCMNPRSIRGQPRRYAYPSWRSFPV